MKKYVKVILSVMLAVFIVSIIILGIAGYFGYQQFTEFRKLQGYTKVDTTFIKEIGVKNSDADEEYKSNKTPYVEMIKDKDQKSEKILPIVESMTEVTRLIDKFFIDNNFPNNPVMLNSLTFGTPDSSENFMKVDFSMNIKGTRDNFFNLLDFISESGNLQKPYRLMAVNSINIVFPDVVTIDEEEEEGEAEEEEIPQITFTLEGEAYFQKSLTDTE